MTTDVSEEIADTPSTIMKYGNKTYQRCSIHFKKHPHQALVLLVAIIAALFATVYGAIELYSHYIDSLNSVRVSGRIEAAETHVIAATATRITSVTVKEGDPVHKGQLIVTLDSQNLQTKLGESGPALTAAHSAQRQADAQVAAVQHQIGVARAKSKGIFAKMFSTKSGREKQEIQIRQSMFQAKMMSMQARSAVASIEGARTQASSKLSYFNITSPIDGICSTRSAEPGELVAAGQIMLTLVDLKSAYLRGFIPESDVARIKVGQSAQVFLDSDSTKPLSGRVTAIDAAPSFTPENIYFKKDRIRQAFGIKISIDHPDGLAKPGMPADATISLNSKKKN